MLTNDESLEPIAEAVDGAVSTAFSLKKEIADILNPLDDFISSHRFDYDTLAKMREMQLDIAELSTSIETAAHRLYRYNMFLQEEIPEAEY